MEESAIRFAPAVAERTTGDGQTVRGVDVGDQSNGVIFLFCVFLITGKGSEVALSVIELLEGWDWRGNLELKVLHQIELHPPLPKKTK